jgi:hypothetical protein
VRGRVRLPSRRFAMALHSASPADNLAPGLVEATLDQVIRLDPERGRAGGAELHVDGAVRKEPQQQHRRVVDRSNVLPGRRMAEHLMDIGAEAPLAALNVDRPLLLPERQMMVLETLAGRSGISSR